MKVLRKQVVETENIQVGDQIIIPLKRLGEFTATAYKVTDEGVLFIFDKCVTRRPMNKTDTNEGGFEKSDLKRWMNKVLLKAFPEDLRHKVFGLTIPTIGQTAGHRDEWYNELFEADTEEPLLLVKEVKDDREWLRNAEKQRVSSIQFACIAKINYVTDWIATYYAGVRPEFWLSK